MVEQARREGFEVTIDQYPYTASSTYLGSLLPDWALEGAIVGLKDGANSFARLDAIRASGAAIGGLWCEDWCGIRETSFGRRLFWDWQWHRDRYPDLPGRIGLRARAPRQPGSDAPPDARRGQPSAGPGPHHGGRPPRLTRYRRRLQQQQQRL